MERIRKAKAFRLKNGPVVVLAPLWPHEVVNAWKGAGGGSPVERALAASLEATKMAIRQIDGREVTYDELEVSFKELVPRTRHRMRLASLLGEMHTPTPTEVQATLDSMTVELDGDRETWRATLPDGRVVVLVELDEQTVGESLSHAEREARGGDAQEILTTMENLRRSLREVDGKPVTAEQLAGTRWDELFDMRETTLLRHVWTEIHVEGAEEVPLGEESPVSGTP